MFPDQRPLHDAFLVLNANRNQPRKRIDVTLQGFARFAQDKPRSVRLFLHMGVEDLGWNVVTRAARYGVADRVLLSTLENRPPNASNEQLNLIYNACDVGLNTSTGEGWGLVAFEHAATGAAQIVPRHSACEELWRGAAEFLEPAFALTQERTLVDGHYVTPEEAARALERLYADQPYRRAMSEAAYRNATRPEYSWRRIAGQWREVFARALRSGAARSESPEPIE